MSTNDLNTALYEKMATEQDKFRDWLKSQPPEEVLVSLMRRSSSNLNQLTRKVHETGRVYDADLEDISQRQEQLWDGVKEILTQLSKLS